MPEVIDDAVLADATALEAADPGQMLRATASAGAQVRLAIAKSDKDVLARVAADGRPRSIVVTGMGGSGISGDVFGAVIGNRCHIPISTVRGYTLPGWVGPLDLVIPVSCSGHTEETLSVAGQAVRRGARLLGIGAAESPLAELVLSARAPFHAVDAEGRMPRASLWTLAIPLLLVGAALELLELPEEVLAATADRLDEVALAGGPQVGLGENAAKDLGLDLAASAPLIWGTGDIGAVSAYRLACQLNENAKQAATFGSLPEANHNQVVALASASASGAARDLFADPQTDEPRLVLIRDNDELPQVAKRADVTREIAENYGVSVTVIRAEGSHPLERLASLVGPIDFASVYAAFARGVDPTPIEPINELKARLAE
jgi:glucose/mannose-6-phosphate isomerase